MAGSCWVSDFSIFCSAGSEDLTARIEVKRLGFGNCRLGVCGNEDEKDDKDVAEKVAEKAMEEEEEEDYDDGQNTCQLPPRTSFR